MMFLKILTLTTSSLTKEIKWIIGLMLNIKFKGEN